jgi:ABC-type bacteriocin/lantibiotic exporter with double-glycine peptidase domain
MLSEYNIHNIGVKTGDKEDNIFDIEVPFIAHIGEFVVVTKITATDVFYIWRDKNVKLPINEFIEAWSGVVLLVEKNDNSIEPDYQQNKKRELIHNFFNAIFLLSVPFFILYMYFNNAIYSWGISLLLITNFIGVYLSYLFVLKQFHIQNEYADKICSLFSQRHIKLYY